MRVPTKGDGETLKAWSFTKAPTVSSSPSRRGNSCLALLFALFTLLPSDSPAENNTSYIYNGTTTNLGAFTIGNNGTNNLLEISNGGAVTNTTGTLGGGGANGDFNSAFVTNTGSMWVNSLDLNIGFDTDANSNRLIIADGGVVEGRNIYPGYFGDYNSVLVSGPGSLLNANGAAFANGYLELGVYGHDNSMVISNGGLVNVNAYGYIGIVGTASNNSVLVTGSGSQWTNAGLLYIGYGGPYSQLRIENGGRVDNSQGVVGLYTPAQVAGYNSYNNYISVSGTGSLWNNTSDLDLGYNGSGNTLVISNGGTVSSLRAFVGGNYSSYATNAGNNTVVVTGPGSLWTNSDTTYGLTVGWTSPSNYVSIADGARVESGVGYLGYYGGSTYAGLYYGNYNTVLVTGSNSVWNMPQYLEVGVYGDYNSLVISNGGRVNNGLGGYIGNVGASNSVVVTGTGSVWSNSGTVYVGFSGTGNKLAVADGAQVYDAGGMYVGLYHGSNQVSISGGSRVDTIGTAYLGYYDQPQGYTNGYNSALISDSNSVWNITSTLEIGYYAPYNKVVVSNGARVNVGGASYVGDAGAYNTLTVTDPGSIWSNNSTLFVGYSTANNYVSVANGAQLFSAGSYVGYSAVAASNNSVLVTGPNSLWNNAGSFNLGYDGGGNQLTISNGARVNNGAATVAYLTTASGNDTVLVTGAGSVWSNTGAFVFGDTGAGNQMTVSAGARVDSPDLTVGYTDDNTILVTGSNSLWSLPAGSLSLGTAGGVGGNNNRLTVADGAQVVSAYGLINTKPTATNDIVVVSGPGAQWTNINYVMVGYAGAYNRMIVTNGGRVDSTGGFLSYLGPGYIATYPTASNAVTVTGADSLWNNTGNLILGYYGGGYNQLTITDGGRVNDVNVYEGFAVAAGSNTMLVSGPGSVWSNSGDLNLGYTAGGDSLTISDGARVDANNVNMYATDNNHALVTGSNTLWSMPNGYLELGGKNTSLIISNGARVISSVGYVGGTTTGSNNVVIVSGSGSQWTNSSTLAIGYVGPNNQVIITNGGRVDDSVGYVGFFGPNPYGYKGVSNTVVVTGSNSLWNNTSALYFGLYGAGNNNLMISDGGQVNNTDAYVSYNYDGSGSNTIVVSGAGSVWNNSGSINFGLGYNSGYNQIIVTNGGRVNALYGNFYQTDNNSILVSGSNSVMSFSGYPELGGNNTAMTISKGGRVESAGGYIGGTTTGTNNILLIADPGSQWTNTAAFTFGYVGPHNQMIITNGGRLDDSTGYIGFFGPGYNPVYQGVSNTVVVTGSNSLWNNTSDLIFGYFGGSGGDRVLITDGARVNNNNTYFGYLYESGAGNQITVSGAGSVWSNSDTLYLGYFSAGGNQVTVTNGGRLYSANGYIGGSVNSGGSGVHVMGADSLWQVAGTVYVGSNAVVYGNNQLVDVTDGGTLEAAGLVSGFNGTGTISNRQGIYQFTLATPTITTNTADSIVLTNGTISYRGVANADIFSSAVARITRQGDNAFRLNNSSNATGLASYTFSSVANTSDPTIYQGLTLINNSLWRSGSLTIGSGGAMLISNGASTVAASLLDAGSVHVVNSVARFSSNVFINGSFISDPSTNIFHNDVTIAPNGLMQGGTGDRFEFQKSLFNDSTNSLFDIDQSTVAFTGDVVHTNAVTSHDYGAGSAPGDFAGAYGALQLGSPSDVIEFMSGGGSLPNALYVWDLILPNFDTNYVSNLHSAFNIYYVGTNWSSNNSYLNDQTYALLGGGFLLPAVPEPSALLLVGISLLLVLRRHRYP